MTNQEKAQEFKSTCEKYGFTYSFTPSVIRVFKTIPIGDHIAFRECDMMVGSVLSKAPLRGGSEWGTDGGSIGGMTAINTGKFQMNKSGSGKAFINALAKI